MREHRAGSTADEHRVVLVRRARQSSPPSYGVSQDGIRRGSRNASMAVGIDLLTISQRLGHASPAITLNVYGHLCDDTDDTPAPLRRCSLELAGRSKNEPAVSRGNPWQLGFERRVKTC